MSDNETGIPESFRGAERDRTVGLLNAIQACPVGELKIVLRDFVIPGGFTALHGNFCAMKLSPGQALADLVKR